MHCRCVVRCVHVLGIDLQCCCLEMCGTSVAIPINETDGCVGNFSIRQINCQDRQINACKHARTHTHTHARTRALSLSGAQYRNWHRFFPRWPLLYRTSGVLESLRPHTTSLRLKASYTRSLRLKAAYTSSLMPHTEYLTPASAAG